MPLILQPAKAENAIQHAKIQLDSYADDPILPSLMPSVPYEKKIEFFERGLLEEYGKPRVKDLEIIDAKTR